MRINVVAAITLALGFTTLATINTSQAATVDTSKGTRLATATPLRTIEDFKGLQKGDKISVRCPMMKETAVTTVRDVDSKGFAKITETSKGWKLNGCNIVLKRVAGSKEVKSFMVCADGTLTPAECSKQ